MAGGARRPRWRATRTPPARPSSRSTRPADSRPTTPPTAPASASCSASNGLMAPGSCKLARSRFSRITRPASRTGRTSSSHRVRLAGRPRLWRSRYPQQSDCRQPCSSPSNLFSGLLSPEPEALARAYYCLSATSALASASGSGVIDRTTLRLKVKRRGPTESAESNRQAGGLR